MLVLGSVGFMVPWLLWGLIILPALWLLLRAVPPAPIIRRFPGIALLLGLADREARVSRLTAGVLQADRLGVEYGLRLPGREISPDVGAAHRHRCLEVLALC